MRIIEITGIAGVGKSYIIELLAEREKTLLDKEIIKVYRLNDFKLLIYFFKNKKSLDILSLSIRIALSLRISLFHKINFIRNTMKKFGKNYFITQRLKREVDETIIIDEGISHLYQNIITQDRSNQDELLKLVNQVIDLADISHTIIIIKAKKRTVFERLKSRGHKRITTEEDIRPFIKMGRHHIKVLKSHFENTITIKNNTTTNLENQLNKI